MYQKRNNNELKIISLFSDKYDKSLYLRQISKLSKIPLKTTQNILALLEGEKILRSSIQGKNKYFTLNLENIKTKIYLLFAEMNKTLLFLENYPQFKIFLKDLKTNIPIIIFGSFAQLKAKRDSDVDILVISKQKLNFPSHLLPHKIHQVNLSEKDFIKSLESRETLIEEIKEKHVVLNDYSFYVNLMWNYYGR